MIPPRPVSDLANRLQSACSTDPLVEWVPGRQRWRITVSNDRVVMTLDHKMTSSGRWVWASSTLHIDGVKTPITSGFEHFIRVWKNPDEIVNRAPVPPPISSEIELAPLDSMPEDIGYMVRKVVEKQGLVYPATGSVDENFWAVEFSFPRATLRLHWDRHKSDPAPSEHVFLIVDGQDKSDLAQGQLSKALAVIAETPHPGAADPASIDGAAGTQRDRGVEVRSTHVMRT